MYCRYCGTMIEKKVKFCPSCGKELILSEDSEEKTKVIEPIKEEAPDMGEDINEKEPVEPADDEETIGEIPGEEITGELPENTTGETGSAMSGSTESDPIDELGKRIMENVEDEWILDPVHQDAALGQRHTLRFDDIERQEYRKPKPEKTPEEEERYRQKVKRQQAEIKEKKQAEDKNRKKHILYGFIAAATAILMIVVIVFLYMQTPVNKLKRAISGNHYETAGEIYNESFAGKSRQNKGDEMLEAAVSKILDEYQNDEVTADKAEGYLNAIIAFWSDSSATDTLDTIRLLEASKQAYETALTCMDQEDYRGAIDNFKLVSRKDSHYEDARSGIEDAQTKYENQCLDKANDLVKKNSYDEAIAVLDEGISYLGSNENLEQRRAEIIQEKEDYEIQTYLDNAADYVDQDNYYEALETLTDGIKAYPEATELSEKLETYKTEYQEEVLQNAENALGSLDDPNYEAAILVLDTAIETIGSDYPDLTETFIMKRDEYSSANDETPSVTIIGVWNVSSVKVGFMPMLPSIYRIYSGKTGDLMQLEIYDNGTYYLEILDMNESGNWSGGRTDSDGQAVFTLDNGSEMRQLEMTTGGKLNLTYMGDVYTFEKTES